MSPAIGRFNRGGGWTIESVCVVEAAGPAVVRRSESKRVLFQLDERAEISGAGWTALMELVSRADGTDRATVFLDFSTACLKTCVGTSRRRRVSIPNGPRQ
jgi:hypothetical protein